MPLTMPQFDHPEAISRDSNRLAERSQQSRSSPFYFSLRLVLVSAISVMAFGLSSCEHGRPPSLRQISLSPKLSNACYVEDFACALRDSQDNQNNWARNARITIPPDFRKHWKLYKSDLGSQYDEYLFHISSMTGSRQSNYVPDEWVYWDNPPERGEQAKWFKDSFEEFRNRHGDGGWVPRAVEAQIKVGKRMRAEQFLNAHRFDWSYGFTYFTKHEFPIAILYIRVSRYPSEEALIEYLERTGLFLYVSRVDAGAGPMTSGSGAQALLPAASVSNGTLTSNSTGSLMEAQIKAILGEWKARVNIEPVQQRAEFYYTMNIVGGGKLLATRSERFWEIDEVTIFFSRPAVERDASGKLLMTLFVNCSYAKGPPDRMPPIGRFKTENDDEFIDRLDFQRRLVAALVSRLGGQILINP